MKTIMADIRAFVAEHKTIIYSIVLILLIDHFFLGGKLKERAKVMVEKFFGALERKVDASTQAPTLPS